MNDNEPLSPAAMELSGFLQRHRDRKNEKLVQIARTRRSNSIRGVRALRSAYNSSLYSIAILKIIVLIGYPLAVGVFLTQLWAQYTLSVEMFIMIFLAHILVAVVDVIERDIVTVQLLNGRLLKFKPARIPEEFHSAVHLRGFRSRPTDIDSARNE
jgi:hypothetical protein